MHVLLLNAGSSSLKGTLMDPRVGGVVAHGLADWAGTSTRYRYVARGGAEHVENCSWKGHAPAVQRFVRDLRHREPVALSSPSALAAVGHRVVHGGSFSASVHITPEVRSRIRDLAQLAPLHNPPSLETIAAAEQELPNVPHVAVFDTAFHATLPAEAHTYAVPERWRSEWGIRRYGFHGLSHAYCARRAAELLGRPTEGLRLVICHLGHGCSASAVHGGRCVETTMGFTPLDGVMMATRSGSIDPGIVLHVQQHHGLSAADVEHALNRESGLLGVSGISGDMRTVLVAANEGHERARLALAVYCRRVRQAIGALATTMGGIDALVFTAGVGENAVEVREAVCAGLEFLGLELDVQANGSLRPDADIARPASRGRVLIISTREDLSMLDEVARVVGNIG